MDLSPFRAGAGCFDFALTQVHDSLVLRIWNLLKSRFGIPQTLDCGKDDYIDRMSSVAKASLASRLKRLQRETVKGER